MKLMAENPNTAFVNFINKYKNISFSGGNFGKACEILKVLFVPESDISVFLALSGALVPAGLRKDIVELLDTGKIAGIVTTGAMLTHDYIEELGYKHKPLRGHLDDASLREKGINRILDVGAPDEAFEKMEVDLHTWLEKKYQSSDEYIIKSTPQFLKELGSKFSSDSILGKCFEKSIPIYCPAITDSILGVHCMTFAEYSKFKLDSILELKEFVSQCFDIKQSSAIVLGGGVPKNYLFQGMLISGKELSYAIQVTMDRPEHGGLSGATLDEAISWGKIQTSAKKTTLIADVTLVLPLFVEYIKILMKRIISRKNL
jgi:deoxyhypusine synthase